MPKIKAKVKARRNSAGSTQRYITARCDLLDYMMKILLAILTRPDTLYEDKRKSLLHINVGLHVQDCIISSLGMSRTTFLQLLLEKNWDVRFP